MHLLTYIIINLPLVLNSSIKLLQQYLDNYENWIFIVKVKEIDNEFLIVIIIQIKSKFSMCIDNVLLQDGDYSITARNTTDVTSSEVLATFNVSASIVGGNSYNFTLSMFHNNTLSIRYNASLFISKFHNYFIHAVSILFIAGFFDVVSFTVLSSDNTNVSFMCDFVQGSQAVGCYVILHEVSIGLYYITTISRNLRVGSVSGVEAGHYSITVYDINSDGTVYLLSPALNSTVIVEMSSTTDISTAVSSTAPLQYSTSQSTTSQPTIMNTQVPVGSTASTLSVSLTITGGIIMLLIENIFVYVFQVLC